MAAAVVVSAGDVGPAWAAAVVTRGPRVLATEVVEGALAVPYEPGLLAAREGPLLSAAVGGLHLRPDVLLLAAAGRDHPRRAGLALHLGAVLDLPTVGVTDRPLLAPGPPPGPARGDTSPLALDGAEVARWVRTAAGARPVVAHAAWRTDPEAAAALVLTSSSAVRTPLPLREARRLARDARARRRP
ncbi:endonuclease V [Geodermatophilus sp. URMC 61]|uniref:endonuclease V n=1 Tax=Geodermatophilus sp. URMC 61 TaxID=3423411 RepID=UPI00406BF6B6